MPSVRIKENEPFDVALRRFKRSCETVSYTHLTLPTTPYV